MFKLYRNYIRSLSRDVAITLANSREDISLKFFRDITKSTSCLHYLLPDPKMDSCQKMFARYF